MRRSELCFRYLGLFLSATLTPFNPNEWEVPMARRQQVLPLWMLFLTLQIGAEPAYEKAIAKEPGTLFRRPCRLGHYKHKLRKLAVFELSRWRQPDAEIYQQKGPQLVSTAGKLRLAARSFRRSLLRLRCLRIMRGALQKRREARCFLQSSSGPEDSPESADVKNR